MCILIGLMSFLLIESFARAIPGSAKQRIEKNVIFSILQNQMLITFDFGGASLCHEILHFVQKSLIIIHCVANFGISWRTMSQTNPTNSRAMATHTSLVFLPACTSVR